MFSALLSALGDGGFTTRRARLPREHVDVGHLRPRRPALLGPPRPVRPRPLRPRLAGHRHARASIACDHSPRAADAVALAACLHRRRRRGRRGAGGAVLAVGPRPELGPLLLLCGMGILSFQIREPTVASRIGFSFLSIILLASAAILGPFGAWFVGLVSVSSTATPTMRWFQRMFNAAMTAIVGVAGGVGLRAVRRVRGPRVALGPDRHRDRARPAAARRGRRAVPHQRGAALRGHPPLPGRPVRRLPAPGARRLGRGLRRLRHHRFALRHPVVPGRARRRSAPSSSWRRCWRRGGPSSSSARSCARTSAPSTRSSPRSATKEPAAVGPEPARRPARRVGRRGAGPRAQPDRHGALCGDAARDRSPRRADAAAAAATGARSAPPSAGSSTATACSGRG